MAGAQQALGNHYVVLGSHDHRPYGPLQQTTAGIRQRKLPQYEPQTEACPDGRAERWMFLCRKRNSRINTQMHNKKRKKQDYLRHNHHPIPHHILYTQYVLILNPPFSFFPP